MIHKASWQTFALLKMEEQDLGSNIVTMRMQAGRRWAEEGRAEVWKNCNSCWSYTGSINLFIWNKVSSKPKTKLVGYPVTSAKGFPTDASIFLVEYLTYSWVNQQRFNPATMMDQQFLGVQNTEMNGSWKHKKEMGKMVLFIIVTSTTHQALC